MLLRLKHYRRRIPVYLVVISVAVIILLVYSVHNILRYDERRIIQLHDWPKNYVYRTKPRAKHDDGPGLEINYTDTVFINEQQSLAEIEENFFRYLETKHVHCRDDVRLGNQHEGGWNVCLSPPFQMSKPCLVYAFGIGEDWRFEDDMADRYGCTVMAYDPSIPLIAHNRTDLIQYQPLGLGARDGKSDKGWNLRTFPTHLLHEGHTAHVIDYLKFDIEYMEWDVLESMFGNSSLTNVKQLGFEIHMTPHRRIQPGGFEHEITKDRFIQMFKILKRLEQFNFRKFNYRLNPFCNYISNVTKLIRSKCYDLHYVNLNYVSDRHVKGMSKKVSLM